MPLGGDTLTWTQPRHPDRPVSYLASLGRGRWVPAHAQTPAVNNRAPEPVDPAHRIAIEEGLAQPDRGEWASDGAIEAFYRRAGP